MADEDKKYKVIRRSTELSIRLSGDSRTQILADAGFALLDLLVDLSSVEIRESITLEVEGVDDDDLLVNWMRELLYEYETSGYMLKEFDIQETGEFAVRVEARGEKVRSGPSRGARGHRRGGGTREPPGENGLPVDRPGEFRAVTANGTPHA